MDQIIGQLFATSPLAAAMFFIWWLTWKELKAERVRHDKNRRRWEQFLMKHVMQRVSDAISAEDDEEEEDDEDEA